MKQPLEKDIQRACLDWLMTKRIFAYKQNNVGIKKPNGSYIPAATTGVPDIIAILKGRYWGVEIKRPNGKMSEAQLAFKDNVDRAGGYYSVVHSVDELAAHHGVILEAIE